MLTVEIRNYEIVGNNTKWKIRNQLRMVLLIAYRQCTLEYIFYLACTQVT